MINVERYQGFGMETKIFSEGKTNLYFVETMDNEIIIIKHYHIFIQRMPINKFLHTSNYLYIRLIGNILTFYK